MTIIGNGVKTGIFRSRYLQETTTGTLPALFSFQTCFERALLHRKRVTLVFLSGTGLISKGYTTWAMPGILQIEQGVYGWICQHNQASDLSSTTHSSCGPALWTR